MNNFLNRFFQKREAPSAEPGSSAVTETVIKGGRFSDRTVYASSPQAALTVSAWHRGLALIGDTVGMMPIEYQKKDRKGGNYIADVSAPINGYLTYGTRLNYLLQLRPNPLMTAFELSKQAAINRIVYGNAFIYIERDDAGEPKAFWLASNGAYIEPTNEFVLVYKAVGGTKVVTASADDVIHLPNSFRHKGSILGQPTLIHARNALTLAATSDALTHENAAKGGRQKIIVREDTPRTPGGTLSFGRFNQNELEKKRQELNSALYENDVLLLTNALDIVNISQTAQAQELLESRKFNVSEIGRFLGVPKILLMDDSGSSYKSPDAATQEFYMRTIAPMAEQKEQQYEVKLLNEYDFGLRRYHVCEQPLFRLDPAGQASIDKLKLETGANTVNEIRQKNDLPSVEGGDKIYLSTNLAELGSEKLRSTGAGRPAANQPQAQEGGES